MKTANKTTQIVPMSFSVTLCDSASAVRAYTILLWRMAWSHRLSVAVPYRAITYLFTNA